MGSFSNISSDLSIKAVRCIIKYFIWEMGRSQQFPELGVVLQLWVLHFRPSLRTELAHCTNDLLSPVISGQRGSYLVSLSDNLNGSCCLDFFALRKAYHFQGRKWSSYEYLICKFRAEAATKLLKNIFEEDFPLEEFPVNIKSGPAI